MKTKAFLRFILFTASLTALISCGGGGEYKTTQTADTTEKKDTAAVNPYADLPQEIQAMIPVGKGIYDSKCFACHQKDGNGVTNTYPPLSHSDYLLSDKVRAVAQTLNGSHKEIIVNGQKYNLLMPQQLNTLDSAVAVINYVLNSFGNKGGYITKAEAKSVKIDPRKKP